MLWVPHIACYVHAFKNMKISTTVKSIQMTSSHLLSAFVGEKERISTILNRSEQNKIQHFQQIFITDAITLCGYIVCTLYG